MLAQVIGRHSLMINQPFDVQLVNGGNDRPIGTTFGVITARWLRVEVAIPRIRYPLIWGCAQGLGDDRCSQASMALLESRALYSENPGESSSQANVAGLIARIRTLAGRCGYRVAKAPHLSVHSVSAHIGPWAPNPETLAVTQIQRSSVRSPSLRQLEIQSNCIFGELVAAIGPIGHQLEA